ncbi:ABC transporter permease [Maliponia aquimaris]|uniref:Dipeptide transport system permease protein DppB n=1 Tax=Maliponia aquimaris TaxID=1673631 RepID=A0A238JQC9_9RHOB|nr:ABC transporter permease [Maliponia aquimaris]SMX32663.1 Dipeptide transport system permease protein DppB [Maliponia aquimaris]
MTAYLIRRLGQALVVMAVMATIVFFGLYTVGNPVDLLINPEDDLAAQEAAMARLGLDKPIHVQFGYFLSGLVQGDLGTSFVHNRPALDLILSRLPATLELAFLAMILAVLLGVPLGMMAGLRPNAPSSRVIMAASVVGFSTPNFWQGLMLIMLFAVFWGVLPAGGRGDTVDVFGIPVSFLTWDGLSHLILPALNLAIYKMSLVIRLARAGTAEVALQDYVKYARARGLSPTRVVGVHVLKNILIPVVTVLGLETGNVIAFAVVTETVFAWPGIGKLLIDSIGLLDRPVVVAYLMLTVFLFVMINFAVDVAYSLLDPRVRVKGGGK